MAKEARIYDVKIDPFCACMGSRMPWSSAATVGLVLLDVGNARGFRGGDRGFFIWVLTDALAMMEYCWFGGMMDAVKHGASLRAAVGCPASVFLVSN